MDFLNQLESDNKEDNSYFTFNDKNENNKEISLPFPFSSQSSVDGGENAMFLNDLKSQGGESFNLGQIENGTQNNNFGGLDFLNTICEVPESSNMIFNSQSDNGFINANAEQNQTELDFINEVTEKDENNFDKFKNNDNEPINVDINNLFKSSETKKNEIFPKNEESKKNDSFQINNLLNIENNDKDNKLNESIKNQGNKNPIKNKAQANHNNIEKQIVKTKPISKAKEPIIINPDIKNNSSVNNKNNNNNKLSSIPIINNNNNLNKQMANNFNPSLNAISNKEKVSSNINMNIKNSSLPIPSSNGNSFNINYNIKDNKENILSFPNIQNKPPVNNQQKINLDDIDQIISQNKKIENKPNIQNIPNLDMNMILNKNFLPSKQDNNKIDKGKDNLKFLSNEISNLFNSSLINGKRTESDQKEKDIQNIDTLLNFPKEKITSKSNINKKQSISKDKINNLYKQINTNAQSIMNNTQQSNIPNLIPLPPDSFDKKSKLIKLNKNDAVYLSQMETTSKHIKKDEEKGKAPTKLEMIQKYNDLASRLNKIREKAKEYRNIGNYFSQLIIANENYNVVYPNVLKKLLEEYNERTIKLLSLMKIKNNKIEEKNNEFFEEVKKYSLGESNHSLKA